jgi:RIO-like serine/threonine protein kinase
MDKILGQGKTATIYLQDSFAVKVYEKTMDQRWIEHEKQILKRVYDQTEILVPKVYESKNHQIKMDCIDGVSLGDRMQKEKYKLACEDMVDLQMQIHSYQGVLRENAHLVYKEIIEKSKVSKNLKDMALASLEKVPVKDYLCHFDLHPLNIMYDQNDYYIIDWMNAKNANPILDIARTYIILRRVAFRFSGKYLTMITKKYRIKKEEVYQAIPAIALIRFLVDNALEDEMYLKDLMKEYS